MIDKNHGTRCIRDPLLRSDIHSFMAKSFRELHANTPFKDNWHLEAITLRLDQVRLGQRRREVIAVPPRSLKSLMCSAAYPAFLLGCDPTERILCISHSQDLAGKFGRQTRQIMESPWYKKVFPATVLRKSTEDVLETTVGGYRMAYSIDAGITGHGGNFILIDDPVSINDRHNLAAMEKVRTLYREAIYTRLDSKAEGRVMLIMQRLHDQDLAGLLLEQPAFGSLVLPAIATEDAEYDIWNGRHYRKKGDLLHPVHEPRSALDEALDNLKEESFAALYQKAPVPSTGKYVQPEWFWSYTSDLDTTGMRIVISVDTAVKGLPTSDYSVATVWGERDGMHYLLDVYREKVDINVLVEAVARLHRRYNADYVLVEQQGSGVALISYLRSTHGIYATEIRPKGDKASRFALAAVFFDRKQVMLPQQAPWLLDFKTELLTFPGGKHDDQVDSVSQYFIWSQGRGSGAFIYHSPYEPEPDHDPEDLADLLAAYRNL